MNRHDHRLAAEDIPDDLRALRALYQRVPHVDIKFRLEIGQEFLKVLRSLAGRYPVAQVAQALSLTPTTIYAMRRVKLDPDPLRWPTDQQMITIERAWNRVKGRGYARGYLSREHRAMHQALTTLLEEGFTLVAVARKMRVPVATLERFRKSHILPPRV